jgi:hypothetical protein
LADQAPSLPAFARRLLAGSPEDRTLALDSTHPDYALNSEHWTLLLDAFEGTGGFANGEYLWPYRNELQEDHRKRQQMARYHNYVETIVDLYVRQVFTQEPTRQTDHEELRAWWEDVDGHGTGISDFLRSAVSIALASGHTGILMDATPDNPVGPSKADQRSRPFLTRYVATAITDWRTTMDAITGIKLREAVPSVGIAERTPDGDDATQFLLWDEDGWARFANDGTLINGDTPGLGLVPFEVLRPKPSVLRPFIGRSLFSHGKIIQALYNRMSEEDQVLRDQAFSLLTVECSADQDVETAKKQLGAEFGTTRAVVVAGKVKYESPDMQVPEQVRANILQIIREIYRIAHMKYERDTLAAESAEAIRLQYKELNEMLQGIAADLQRVEMALARFFFAWTTTTPEQAQAAFDQANVSIEYPDDFFLADLRLDLDAWVQAIAMNLGATMTKRIKKKAVRRIDPEISLDDVAIVDKEIDAQPDEVAMAATGMADQLRQGAQARLGELTKTTSGESG